jgi:pantothenate kinase
MKNDNNKTLMFAISNSLSKPEAISFAKSINTEDRYYITCVHRNPKARHLEKRERYVVVRDLRKGEVVPNGYALFVKSNELSIT